MPDGSATVYSSEYLASVIANMITGGSIDANGHLILSMSGGGTVDAGYVKGSSTPEDVEATEATLARRNAAGQTKFATPTEDQHAANKAYVDTVDAARKTYVDTAVADASLLTTGEIPDDVIPERITLNGITVTDADLANESGWYRGYDAANSPTSGTWYYFFVMRHNASYIKQFAYHFFSAQMYQRTLNNGVWTSWVPNDGLPVGSVMMWGGDVTEAPYGWLRCIGGEVSRTDYAALFAVLGTAYGNGDGSTTFNLPDFYQKFPTGAGDTGSYVKGAQGGTSSHTHTMPSHSHALSNNGYAEITLDDSNDWILANLNTAVGSTFQADVRTGTGTLTVGTSTVSGNIPVVLGGNTDSKDPGDTNSSAHIPPFQAITFLIKAF